MPDVALHSLPSLDLPEPIPNPPALPASPNESTLHTNLLCLARTLEDGNLLAIPITAGRATLSLWSRFLSLLPGRELATVVTELNALNCELATPTLNPQKLGQRLLSLGLATRTVAAERMGPLGLALDRLADGLIASALALDSSN